MRRALGRMGGRAGLAAALVVIVGAVVAVARFVDRSDQPDEFYAEQPAPAVTLSIDPTAGDDAEVLPTPRYSDDDAVIERARAFAVQWLRQDLSADAWHAKLLELTTKSAGTNLAGADPASVPARRIVDDPRLVLRTQQFAQVRIGLDGGDLLLSLLLQDGEWLVDGIDWDAV